MFCPVCKEVALLMTERQGIEIDYCPQCRGVWLDRGELDKIIERSELENRSVTPAQAVAAAPEQPLVVDPRQPQYSYGEGRFGHGGGHHGDSHGGHHGSRHGGFLKRLFD